MIKIVVNDGKVKISGISNDLDVETESFEIVDERENVQEEEKVNVIKKSYSSIVKVLGVIGTVGIAYVLLYFTAFFLCSIVLNLSGAVLRLFEINMICAFVASVGVIGSSVMLLRGLKENNKKG